jgi:hydrogenase 3 maturation protease
MRNPNLAHALTRTLRQTEDPGAPRSAPEAGARRTVLLGVGSELRSDDAAGVLIANRVAELKLPMVWSIAGGTAPENLTADVRKLSPTHLLIIDSADMGETPGTIRLIDPDQIGGISFGTHALPLSVLAGYLSRETGCRVIVMGIQPRSLDFDGPLSAEVEEAVKEAVQALAAALGEPAPGR